MQFNFEAFYAKVPTGSSYTMDHCAITYMYDRSGRLRLGLRHTQTADEYAADSHIPLTLTSEGPDGTREEVKIEAPGGHWPSC